MKTEDLNQKCPECVVEIKAYLKQKIRNKTLIFATSPIFLTVLLE